MRCYLITRVGGCARGYAWMFGTMTVNFKDLRYEVEAGGRVVLYEIESKSCMRFVFGGMMLRFA